MRRLLGALRRGAPLLAASALLGAVAGVVVARTAVPREYEARVLLQWDRGAARGRGDEARELQTLLDSVALPESLESARARLHLATTLEALGRRVQIDSSGESNVVTLKATAEDGEAAARLADAVAAAFLEHRVRVERQRLLEQIERLSAGVEAAREAVARTRGAYDAFCAEHGVVGLPVEAQAAIEHAARLRSEADMALAEAEAELAAEEALRRVTRSERRTAVLQETEVLPDGRKLAEAKAELAALGAQLSGDHPRVQALEAQIEALGRRVAEAPRAAAAERVVGQNPRWEAAQQDLTRASARREAARRRQHLYLELADRADAAIVERTRIGGEASARLASLRAGEEHLADLEGQLAGANAAILSPSSGFRVLAPAKAPALPSRSRRAAVALAGPALGLALAALFVLLRAIRGLRVLTGRELAFWGRAPVVASSPWPRDERALEDLVADLDLSLRRSSGATLVLGFGEAEADPVDLLVSRLSAQQRRVRGREGSARSGRRRRARLATAAPLGPSVRAAPRGLTLPALRRAVREASRVLVLVESGRHRGPELSSLEARLGRGDGIGLVLLGLGADLIAFPDRAGDVEGFWRSPRAAARRWARRPR